MEIIRIENGSYKISLNASEAREYNITADEQVQRAEFNSSVKRLLDTLREKEQIDLGDGKISAEVYISKDGGCEVFASRVQSRAPAIKAKPLSQAIYKFERLKELLCACVGLRKADYDGSGSIYYNAISESYYLFLSGIYQKDIKYAFLCEYGSRIKLSLSPYIIEHCKCICENNAIEIFSKLL